MFDRILRSLSLTLLLLATALPALASDETADRKPAAQPRSTRCTARTLVGVWGYVFEGEIVGVGSFRTLGQQAFDEDGNIAITASSSFAGQISRYDFTGTYTLERDCTGTMEAILPDGTVGHLDFVVVDGGRKILAIEMDPGVLLTGTFERR